MPRSVSLQKNAVNSFWFSKEASEIARQDGKGPGSFSLNLQKCSAQRRPHEGSLKGERKIVPIGNYM